MEKPEHPHVSDHAAIFRYIFEFEELTRETSVSSFRAALRDARWLIGRDLSTGKPETAPRRTWPGTVTYLTLLDQLGQVVCPLRGRSPSRTPFLAALEDFAPSVSARDRETLYALRNAFVHEFGLANPASDKSVARRHLFTVVEADDPRLVVYPDIPWNGKFGVERKGGATEVNITQVAQVVEDVVSTVETLCHSRELTFVDGMTRDMAIERFGLRVRNPDGAGTGS